MWMSILRNEQVKINHTFVYVCSVYDSSEYASDTAKQAIIVKVGVCSFLQHDMTATVTMFPINPKVKMSTTATKIGTLSSTPVRDLYTCKIPQMKNSLSCSL